jgi:hypothetical protein
MVFACVFILGISRTKSFKELAQRLAQVFDQIFGVFEAD